MIGIRTKQSKVKISRVMAIVVARLSNESTISEPSEVLASPAAKVPIIRDSKGIFDNLVP